MISVDNPNVLAYFWGYGDSTQVQDSWSAARLLLSGMSRFREFSPQDSLLAAQRQAGGKATEERKRQC